MIINDTSAVWMLRPDGEKWFRAVSRGIPTGAGAWKLV